MVAMTSSLHHAAERPFCMCQLLHFCQMLSNPSIKLELQYIVRKPMKHRFQQCIVSTEIYKLFTQYFSQNTPLKPLDQWGKWPQNPSFPWGTWTPSNTWMHGWPHSPSQTTARSLHTLPHNYATKTPLVTMECPKLTPKTALSHSTITTSF